MSSDSHAYTNRVLKGALLLILGETLLVIMAALIKYSAETLPNPTIVFFRNAFGFLFLLPFLIPLGYSGLKTRVLPLHLIRSGTGIIAMYGFFYVIANAPLAQASLVKLTAPFFLPIIAYLWLSERINQRTWVAILLGFIGVTFIIQPGTDAFSWVLVLGLGAAALASMAKTTIRRMALTEPSLRVVFYFSLFTTLISAAVHCLNWVTPSHEQLAWLALTGLTGTLGQLFITKAYQIAKPGQIGPYTYTAVLFAALFGWLFWDEPLTAAVVIGSVLISFAGIINLKKPSAKAKISS